jgi:CRISPR-associated protein Cmr4
VKAELARSLTVKEGDCLLANPALLSGDKLHLEAFEYDAKVSPELPKLSDRPRRQGPAPG